MNIERNVDWNLDLTQLWSHAKFRISEYSFNIGSLQLNAQIHSNRIGRKPIGKLTINVKMVEK